MQRPIRSTDIGSPYWESPEFVFNAGLVTQLSWTTAKSPTGNSDRPITAKAMPVPGEWTFALNHGFCGMPFFSQFLVIYVNGEQRREVAVPDPPL